MQTTSTGVVLAALLCLFVPAAAADGCADPPCPEAAPGSTAQLIEDAGTLAEDTGDAFVDMAEEYPGAIVNASGQIAESAARSAGDMATMTCVFLVGTMCEPVGWAQFVAESAPGWADDAVDGAQCSSAEAVALAQETTEAVADMGVGSASGLADTTTGAAMHLSETVVDSGERSGDLIRDSAEDWAQTLVFDRL